MTDPNDNRTEVAFDTRGMVTARAERGKSSQSLGDTLSDPTEMVSYDLFNWKDNGLPNYTHRQMRMQHGGNQWLEQYTYTGGLGEVVMRKRKVAPGQAFERDANGDLVYDNDGNLQKAHADPRWVGTGRTIYNNKGDIVKQYEPYFSSIPDYEDEAELVEYGVTPVFHYDAPGRMIQVDHPDGTLEKVTFDAWQQQMHDPNDTVQDSTWYSNRNSPDPSGPEPSDPDERAAWLAAQHNNTPQQSKLDVKGRPYVQVDDNGSQGTYETKTTLDIAGNPLEVKDAKGRVTTTNHFDMRDEQAKTDNIDSGLRRVLLDVMREPIYRWDDRGHTFRHTYDNLRRPREVFMDDGSGEKKVEETVYGESQGKANNHRGEVYQTFDQSGKNTIKSYDFKGNPDEQETVFAQDYTILLDWSGSPTLESETHTKTITYNALDLPVKETLPDNTVIKTGYDAGGFFHDKEADLMGTGTFDTYITSVTYNARGQRKKIQYGNGAQTKHEYDPETFRLTRLLSTRNSGSDILQDEKYTFDAVGNIVEVVDNAQQNLYFSNTVVSPSNKYYYDAIYRLKKATGREHPGQGPHDNGDYPINDLPHPNQTDVLERYTEDYEYDEVGNILKITHSAGSNNWTKNYDYQSSNNYLTGFNGTTHFTYDDHGNITSMPHLTTMTWDYADNLREVDLSGGGTAYYVYDSSGQRVRKVVVNSGFEKDRKYLDEYELYREIQNGSKQKERSTVQIMDQDKLLTNNDILTFDNGSPLSNPDITKRYQIGNHIDSISIELDDGANLITYEEYFPFGKSSFRSGRSDSEVKLKRYRFTSKERDEETGLYYFGARYYAGWIGRFVSKDPMESQNPGKTPYHYASNNPVNNTDPTGGQENDQNNSQDQPQYTIIEGGQGEEDIVVKKTEIAEGSYAHRTREKMENENLMSDEDVNELMITEPGNTIYEIKRRSEASREDLEEAAQRGDVNVRETIPENTTWGRALRNFTTSFKTVNNQGEYESTTGSYAEALRSQNYAENSAEGKDKAKEDFRSVAVTEQGGLNIYFEKGNYQGSGVQLRNQEQGQEKLNKVKQLLSERDDILITIEGHASKEGPGDEEAQTGKGTKGNNLELSKKRAEKTKKYLLRGLEEERANQILNLTGKGEQQARGTEGNPNINDRRVKINLYQVN